MTIEDLKNQSIAFLGMGTNNAGLAEYLKSQGIEFEVFEDWDKPEELTGRIDSFDVVFRSPGLPYLSEPVQRALEKGVEVSSQTKLFFDLCPCPIVGVTGTKGKGTTATLIARLLEAGGETARLAGNIGRDPFEFIEDLDPGDFVVLELSSFQLQDLHKSPHTAVMLKTTVEHLDHHKSREEYRTAKANILKHQSSSDIAVINYDHEDTRALAGETRARIWWNSTREEVNPGCFVSGEEIVLAFPEEQVKVMDTAEVGLTGRFNLENVTAAASSAAALGTVDPKLFKQVFKEFQGLEHRLEFVTEKNGLKYYNDSFSTTPETAIAALSAFDRPVILIAGGSRKGSDYSGLAREIAVQKVKALLAIGTTGPEIAKLARNAGFEGKVVAEGLSDMREIVKKAGSLADPEDVVLLSPASASFDMFADYKHRGELFKKYVHRL